LQIDGEKNQQLNPKLHLGDLEGEPVMKVPFKAPDMQQFLDKYKLQYQDHLVDIRVQLLATTLTQLQPAGHQQQHQQRVTPSTTQQASMKPK